MSKVETVEGQVKDLSPEELAAFREWFAIFDADAWDLQFAADVGAGKVDHLAECALRDHASGRSRKF
jgi:hypothetical protein